MSSYQSIIRHQIAENRPGFFLKTILINLCVFWLDFMIVQKIKFDFLLNVYILTENISVLQFIGG